MTTKWDVEIVGSYLVSLPPIISEIIEKAKFRRTQN